MVENTLERHTIFCTEYEAREKKHKFCKNFHNELLCRSCKGCKKFQNIQKQNKNCNRHKGCPNCYLIKKHGFEMEENASKSIKDTIQRKNWIKMMDENKTNKERELKPDQGHPSQGTAGPPRGN